MKKYTKRLKADLKAFRFIKNVAAVGMIMYGAVHALILGCCPPAILLQDTIYALLTTVGGEVLFNIGMTAVETAGAIQERDEAI